MPEYLRLDDAANRLHVSRRTVFRLLAEGDLVRVKVGRRTLIPVDSLNYYLMNHVAVARAAEGRS